MSPTTDLYFELDYFLYQFSTYLPVYDMFGSLNS